MASRKNRTEGKGPKQHVRVSWEIFKGNKGEEEKWRNKENSSTKPCVKTKGGWSEGGEDKGNSWRRGGGKRRGNLRAGGGLRSFFLLHH